jgi:hypothetical protein
MGTRYEQHVGKPEHEPERSPVRFDQLNGLGKAVYGLAAASDLAARGLDAFLNRAARIAAESERAFKEGRSGQVEDARWRDVDGPDERR